MTFEITWVKNAYDLNLQKDVSLPFSTIEDSGINAKFVNAVYDALLNTVSKKDVFKMF